VKTAGVFEITTENKALKAGETYSLTFNTKQLSQIQGYQFTLGYENLSVEKLKTGVTGIENFGLHKMDDGMITTSWNSKLVSSQQTVLDNNEQATTLFTIEFKAQQNGRFRDTIDFKR